MRSGLRLPAEQSTEVVFRPAISRLGFYKLVLTATDSVSGETFRKFLTLGVIQPPACPDPGRRDGRFGLTFMCHTPEQAPLTRKLGVTSLREAIVWSGMERNRDAREWGVMDLYTARAAA